MRGMLIDVFAELDRRIEERWAAGNLSHGFWRSGAIPPLRPVDTLREYGFWQGTAVLGNELSGQVSVALIGGHTRIGLFLPNTLLESAPGGSWGDPLRDQVSRAHDGQPAQIVRRMGGDTLFDRILSDAPFSANWLSRCVGEPSARAILENHLAWRVIDLWESAIRTLHSSAHRGKWVVHSTAPLPANLTEVLPITILDAFEVSSGQWVTVCDWTADTLDRESDTGDREERQWALQRAISRLLPDHRISVQEMARGEA